MKRNVVKLVLISTIGFAACQQQKKPGSGEDKNEIVKVEAPDNVPEPTDLPPMKTETVQGFVLEVVYGKDGYTAKIETSGLRIVAVTISRSNLKDPSQYKDVKVGESLKVTGDSWRLENQDQLTVREIN